MYGRRGCQARSGRFPAGSALWHEKKKKKMMMKRARGIFFCLFFFLFGWDRLCLPIRVWGMGPKVSNMIS